MTRFVGLCCLLLISQGLLADSARVAVASNFSETLKRLVEDFESRREHRIELVTGSTGKLYAQILQGAPYDVFLAADALRPGRLESMGRALSGSRFTYALGRLVLWRPQAGRADELERLLQTGRFDRLAIANPKLAPYGRAAAQLLKRLGLWQQLQLRIVRGENVAQAYHFVASGNAELGLVAWSQLQRQPEGKRGSWWWPSSETYDPIAQQAVLLRDNPAARAFMEYLSGERAGRIIESDGYLRP